MAHIQHRSGRRKPWQVRYRDPSGRERARSFLRKADASRFAFTVEADRLRGEWTDPRLSKTTVSEWSERWLRTKVHLKPKTLAGYESNLRAHVLPAFGSYQLRHVERMAVEEWVADLQASGLGPSGVRQARQALNSRMMLAVDAGYLVMNPVAGVKVARQPDPEMLFLSAEEAERPAAAIREPYGTLVDLLAYGGLRWGEAAAVRRKRCDILRTRIEVTESLSEARGKLHFGTTKTYRRRMVIIPAFLSELMDEHLAQAVDDGLDALVFTSPLGKAAAELQLPAPGLVQGHSRRGAARRTPHTRPEAYLRCPAHRSGCAPQGDPDSSRPLIDLGDDGSLRAPLPIQHGGSGGSPRRGAEQSSRGPTANQRSSS